MQQQTTQPASLKSRFSWKRIVILVLSALVLLAAIPTGIFGIIKMGTLAPTSLVGAVFLFIIGVGGLAIPFAEKLFPQSTSNTASSSTNNTQSRQF